MIDRLARLKTISVAESNQIRKLPTLRQQRILAGLHTGDLLWEVPAQPYFTQYNERTGRQNRVHKDVLVEMERFGWIQRFSQDPSAHKLDFWEITAEGRRLLEAFLSHRKGPASQKRDARAIPTVRTA